ncbi:hypothetical protein SAMN05421874_1419 [Nonomuraea maritima]|jgi:hypothetical protein|uniref:Uncharacterized protein n=1 Tax=Nonomuraea maritima TaxID=683260 RepID=A0A1G9QXQ3_9ACTN|nr:hypothetical protein [Nonomuraea maritima]SDM15025.1 hypothetical protein SAMN05421874_1419 [Nonomuraea maritima]
MSGRRGRRRERGDDDVGGIPLGLLAVHAIAWALAHPWRALRSLLRPIKALGRRVRGSLKSAAGLGYLIVWSRTADRRPTFEDVLRQEREERDPW